MASPAETETERILREYERREREIPADFYALSRPANLFSYQGQQRAVRAALERARAFPLESRQILDVGCGRGQWLSHFEVLGARRDNIAAIDLDPSRVVVAQERFPGADVRIGDAAHLPWDDSSFDLVTQSTVFTSILDAPVRAAVAAEMLRVLKPSGVIVWYDFLFDNPNNKNVRGVGRREVRQLFPDCTVHLCRTTLAPPLARRIVPVSWPLARFLEQLRLLNTHYLGTIRKATRD